MLRIDPAPRPQLSISAETLAFIIAKAREFDAQVAPVDETSGSNPADDLEVDILEDRRSNPTRAELRGALAALNADERDELVALMWIGRGDFAKDEWPAALAQAEQERRAHGISYLMETPLLADHLEQALDQFGISIEDDEIGRM